VTPFLHRRAEDAGAPGTPAPAGDGALAALAGATGWLNSPPLTASGLRGRVVLVSFWTYTCINWLRTQPYLRAWAERYAEAGLVVVGVHTPEFDVERDADNVRRAVADLRVAYPVAVDTDYAIWDAFGNQYWPAVYLVDARGRVRHHHFGEGGEDRTEQAIRQLLTEAGARDPGATPAPVDAAGAEVAADWDSLASPETYLGYARTANSASAGGMVPDERHLYGPPAALRRNQWALSGDWTVRGQAAVLNRAGGTVACRFHARDLHLVMGPVVRGDGVRFRVTLDGRPPGPAHGTDTDDAGEGRVTDPRLYQLIRQPGPVTDRTFEIAFLDPRVRGYALTFG
jgi:thiol-disulfide isomerase/thioredoxin